MGKTVEVEKVIAMLRNRNGTFTRMAYNIMNRSALAFIGDIQQRQMSGRPGLRVVSGTLRRSWFPVTYKQEDDLVTQISTHVKYAKVHQTGSKKKNIPKRLFIYERFHQIGKKLFVEQFKEAIRKLTHG